MNIVVYLLALSVSIFSMVGCSSDSGTPAPPPARPQVAKAVPPPIAPGPSAPQEEQDDYRYQGLTRRDPFVPLITVKVPVRPDADEPLEPLEQYDLSQLRLVAVLLGFDPPRAMIKAPDGKAYIVIPGNKAGKNRGVISNITPDAVILKESVYDQSGNIESSEKRIALPKREGA